jgi:hypothetical protein
VATAADNCDWAVAVSLVLRLRGHLRGWRCGVGGPCKELDFKLCDFYDFVLFGHIHINLPLSFCLIFSPYIRLFHSNWPVKIGLFLYIRPFNNFSNVVCCFFPLHCSRFYIGTVPLKSTVSNLSTLCTPQFVLESVLSACGAESAM